MTDEFVLSQTDGRPMYLQIIEQIKQKIALGDWPPGYQLPSIREFAVTLKVSVITVKRAYHELEVQGVIATQQGKGSFVMQLENIGQRLRNQELEEQLNAMVKTGKNLGLSIDELIKQLKQTWQE